MSRRWLGLVLGLAAVLFPVLAGYGWYTGERELAQAARAGDVAAVDRWLQRHAHEAGKPEHAEKLVEAARMVFRVDSGGRRVHTQRQAARVLLKLVDSRSDPNDPVCQEIFRIAAYHGCQPPVQHLIRRGIDEDCPDLRGRTALVGAIMQEDEEMVRLLLASGADPNTTFYQPEGFLRGPHTVLGYLGTHTLLPVGSSITAREDRERYHRLIRLLKRYGGRA